VALDRFTCRSAPRPIAIVFQAPSLLPPLDVVENVALPLLLEGVNRTAAREAALSALDRLGLGAIAAKLPEESPGAKRKESR